MYRISDFEGKSNNLNFIKFIAAILVIYTHSYGMITGNNCWLGGFAVAIFFFSSGYFVTKSLLRKKDIKAFVVSRFARLYPVFALTVILTAFVLGPIATTLPVTDYFTNLLTYKYLLELLFIPRYLLPGVFDACSVNASLWTMTLEVLCYIALGFAYKLKMLNKRVLLILNIPVAIAVLYLFGVKSGDFAMHAYVRAMCTFVAGVDFFVFKDKISFDIRRVVIFVIIGVFLVAFGRRDFAIIVILPYLLTAIVFCPKQLPEFFGKVGDLSYSMYLVAFPIQRLLIYYLNTSYIHNFIAASAISVGVAVLMYVFVERKASERILKKLSF